MHFEPDVIRRIDRTALRENDYFSSLLEQAWGQQMLGMHDMERIRYECLALLAEKTRHFTAGDSSSIPTDTAKELLRSMYFTIGLCLKDYSNPDEAAACLQNTPIRALYQKGRQRIDRLTAATKAAHTKLTTQLIHTPNVFYNATLKDGIRGFFKLYNPDLFAHAIHITADYPLYNPVPRLDGIEFIHAYVGAAYYENRFMQAFADEDIHRLLCAYAQDYAQLPMNLYEPVLAAALGCVLAGTDPGRLDMTARGLDCVTKKLEHLSKTQITQTLSDAAETLCAKLQCADGLCRYVQNSVRILAGTVSRVLSEHLPNRVFLLPADGQEKPEIRFSFGEKMEDAQYRRVLDAIHRCETLAQKLAVIRKAVHSLADLEDVLLDAPMTSSEMQSVFAVLSLPEIAALSKKYGLQYDAHSLHMREQEAVLRESLRTFIADLPAEKQRRIRQMQALLRQEE